MPLFLILGSLNNNWLLGTVLPFDNLFIQLTLIVLVSPIITLLLSLHGPQLSKAKAAVYLVLQTIFLTLVSYAGILYLFVVPPLMAMMTQGVINSYDPVEYVSHYARNYSFWDLFYPVLLYYILGILLLVVLPYVLLRWMIVRTRFLYHAFKLQHPGNTAIYTFLSVIILTGVISFWLTRPPQLRYVTLLDRYTQLAADTTATDQFARKQQLVRELQTNRTAAIQELKYLRNAYERYPIRQDFSLTETMDDFYEDMIGAPTSFQRIVDATFMVVAQPFVLNTSGDFFQQYTENSGDYAELARNLLAYDVYSDQGLTYDARTAQNFSQISLTDRSVTITTQQEDRLALVTVTDSFSNTSFSDQETTAEFMLPAGSVVVDLKLGLNLEFPGLVAPRGAARATYEFELRQRRDPALLQQVGPDQYRLRVFPVPQKGQQKVQFSYITPIAPEGYGLPKYIAENNYTKTTTSNGITSIAINGSAVNLGTDTSFVKTTQDFCNLQDGSLGTTTSSFIIATTTSRTYHCTLPDEKLALTAPVGKRIAIMLDVSNANKQVAYTENLIEFFAKNAEILQNNTIELYQVNTSVSEPTRLTPQNFAAALTDIVWFENGTFTKMLSLSPSDVDAVFFVTSSSSQSAGTEEVFEKIKALPALYLVYPLYETAPDWEPSTSEVLFNKEVYVSPTIEDAWLQLIHNESSTTTGTVVNSSWQIVTVTGETLLGELLVTSFDASTIATDFPELFKNFSKLRAQMYSSAAGVNLRNPTDGELAVLDLLSTQAQQLHVVTPLTSMIALVNDQQLERLEANSEAANRYSDWSNQNNARNFSGRGIINPAVGGINPGSGWSNSNSGLGNFSAESLTGSQPRALPSESNSILSGPTEDDFKDSNYLAAEESKINNKFVIFIVSCVGFIILIVGIIYFKKRRTVTTQSVDETAVN